MHTRPIIISSPPRAAAWGLEGAAAWPLYLPHWIVGSKPGCPLPDEESQALERLCHNLRVNVARHPSGLILAGPYSSFDDLIAALKDPNMLEALAEGLPHPEALAGLGHLLKKRMSAMGGRSGARPASVQTSRGSLDLSRPKVMGILNVTPDSFFPGSRAQTLDAALRQGLALLEAGADILDIGGESTRPGAEAVSLKEEIQRVVPVIKALRRETSAPISVDTAKAEVASLAVDAGAGLINDVWSFQADPKMAEVAASTKAGVILMHGRGTPKTMGGLARYDSVVGEVLEELGSLFQGALDAGIEAERIVLDPGIGFAKVGWMNVTLLAELEAFHALGRPLLLGASRKSFLGQVFGHSLEERLPGSLAAVARGVQGGAAILRVHDVAETRRLVDVLLGIDGAKSGEGAP